MATDIRAALEKGSHEVPPGWTWEWFTDVMDVEGGTQPPAATFVDSPRTGYVRLVQIRDFETDAHLTYIPDSTKWRKCGAADVLIGRYGAALGRICTGLTGAYNVALAKVVPSERLHQRFVYYLLNSRYFQAPLIASGARSAQAGFNKDGLAVIPLPLPPIPEQQRIAHILGTLDDKIDLNRRMSATLETMSRAIFKSWFVDFDPVRQKAAGKQPVGMDAQTAALFPDSFEDSEIGEVPKGWRVGPLSRFFTIGLGGAWGDEGPTEKSSQAVHCLRGIDCHDLAEGLLPEVPSRWISPKQCSDRLLTDGTILVEGSGSFCGRSLCWRPEYESLVAPPVVYSNFCKRLSPQCSPSQAHIIWCQMRAAYASGEFAAFRVGTAFPNFDMQGAMDNFRVVVPPDTLAQRYATIAWQSQRLDLTRQSRTLAALRDTLLPKLLSGELRVPKAEQAVEEAVR
jgi:type I restriction enzyme, S subunit